MLTVLTLLPASLVLSSCQVSGRTFSTTRPSRSILVGSRESERPSSRLIKIKRRCGTRRDSRKRAVSRYQVCNKLAKVSIQVPGEYAQVSDIGINGGPGLHRRNDELVAWPIAQLLSALALFGSTALEVPTIGKRVCITVITVAILGLARGFGRHMRTEPMSSYPVSIRKLF